MNCCLSFPEKKRFSEVVLSIEIIRTFIPKYCMTERPNFGLCQLEDKRDHPVMIDRVMTKQLNALFKSD